MPYQIQKIKIKKSEVTYLQKRQLEQNYKKQKNLLLEGNSDQVDFKLRKPKQEQIYSFRLNKKFRAFCIFEDSEKTILRVFKINDHQ